MRLMILLAIGLSSCVPVLRAEDKPDAKPDPRENLDNYISESIRLIEAKDTVAVIKFIAPPKRLKQMLNDKSIEELAKEVEPNLPKALKVLKQIRGTKPRMNESETTATFEFPEAVDGQTNVTFTKEDKFWFLR